jgi:hypothetical protein
MRRKKMHGIVLNAFMLGGAVSAPWPAAGQDAKQPYASMTPVEQYWYSSTQAYPQLKSFPPIRVFAVVVDKWSDGTPAPGM